MAKKWYISEKYLTDKEVSVRPKLADLSLSPKSDIRFPQVQFAKYIQELIDDGDIIVGDSYENVVTISGVTVSTKDTSPSVTVQNGTVSIVTQKKINYIIVNGEDATNATDGTLTIFISSPELSGNRSKETLVVPIIQKTDKSPMAFGDPSPSNPYSLDIDNNPAIKVVGVGTSIQPSISIKLYGLTNIYDKYTLTIIPL